MVFGLLGANGAGKSTTIECMLGTKKPEKGSVTILGSSPTADRKALFEKTGVQFQESNYQEQIRVAELCEVCLLYTSGTAQNHAVSRRKRTMKIAWIQAGWPEKGRGNY